MLIWIFYLSTFIYSWTIWLLGITFFKDIINPYLLISLGGIGPLIGVIIYFLKLKDNKLRIDYLKRIIKIKNIKLSIWLITLFSPLFFVLTSKAIFSLIFIKEFNIEYILSIDPNFIKFGFTYAIILLFFGPIPEELAWRGVAFEELFNKYNYYKAQLITAGFWALWHLPLFFINNSYQAKLGINTIAFYLFFINVIASSFITCWLYLKSNHSIFIAILFHYLTNLIGEMFSLNKQAIIIKTLLMLVFVIIIELYNRYNKSIFIANKISIENEDSKN